MKICYRLLAFLTASLILIKNAKGQLITDTSGKIAVRQFYEVIADNALLYNGTEYVNADPTIAGDPYFLGKWIINGNLVYNNVTYSDVPLLYDSWNDRVISQRFNNGVLMTLISEKIKSFSLGNHIFIRVTKNATDDASPSTGFYEVIYGGNTQVIARHRKQIYESASLEKSFVESTHYFVRKDGKYFAIKNKKDLFGVLHDKSDGIKKLLKNNNLSYKKEPQETLVQAATFYDQPGR